VTERFRLYKVKILKLIFIWFYGDAVGGRNTLKIFFEYKCGNSVGTCFSSTNIAAKSAFTFTISSVWFRECSVSGYCCCNR